MRIDRYMGLCLGHPRHGYYMTRDPLGEKGDFVTSRKSRRPSAN